MGRGKIEIKKIENATNRQVTYSKRKNGIFKKAQELTVLCDAQVSLIMFSNTNKLHEYISPNSTTKKMIDRYQHALGVDIWSSQYQKMQEDLRKLMDVNTRLRTEIRHRMGDDLDGLNYEELRMLEKNMEASAIEIRGRKLYKIKTQTETSRKKVRSLEQVHGKLLVELGFKETRSEYPHGLVDNGGGYEYAIPMNGAQDLYAFRLHHNHQHLHHGNSGNGSSDLTLA